MELVCSNCHSESVQKVTAIYSSGTTTSHAHTTGNLSGLSYGSDGVGVVSGSTSTLTRGVSQSMLASKLSPPVAKSENWFLLSLVVGVPVGIGFLFVFSIILKAVLGPGLISGIIWIASFFAGIILTFRFFISKANANKEYNRTVYADQMRDWQQQYYCHKCDSVFTPRTAK